MIREIHITSESNLTNRVGYFLLPHNKFAGTPASETVALDPMIRVLHVEELPELDRTFVLAESLLFDWIESGTEVPQYEVTVTLKNGTIRFYYERIGDE